MSKNEPERLRDRSLHLRLTEMEYLLIQERMKAAGAHSIGAYVRDASINGYIINVDYSEMKNLAYEINKIGTNINQIAHKINSENLIYQTEMDELQDKLDLIWKIIRKKFYQLP